MSLGIISAKTRSSSGRAQCTLFPDCGGVGYASCSTPVIWLSGFAFAASLFCISALVGDTFGATVEFVSGGRTKIMGDGFGGILRRFFRDRRGLFRERRDGDKFVGTPYMLRPVPACCRKATKSEKQGVSHANSKNRHMLKTLWYVTKTDRTERNGWGKARRNGLC